MEAAFFDLDKTVIAKASMVAFGRPLYREGLLSRWLVVRALYGQLVYLYLGADEARMARMRDKVLRITEGWDQTHIRRVVEETMLEVIEPIVYEEALDLIREHREAGRLVVIISASPEEVVEPLAGWLGADVTIASRAEVDEQGRYTGRMERYAHGPVKAEVMAELAAQLDIDMAESYGYSDSATDIPMLEAVGHPVAVNPDRALLRAARANGWAVRWFNKQVSLRERAHLPTPKATAAVGGGVAAAAAGVAAWWWLHREPPAPPSAGGLASMVRAGRSLVERAPARVRRRGPS